MVRERAAREHRVAATAGRAPVLEPLAVGVPVVVGVALAVAVVRRLGGTRDPRTPEVSAAGDGPAEAAPRATSYAARASVSRPSSRSASPATSAIAGSEACGPTDSRTDSANPGSSRRATASRSEAWVESPAARAARPLANASTAAGDAESTATESGMKASTPPSSVSSTGQIALRGMPANSASSDSPVASIARFASRRASVGRPAAAMASAAITSAMMSSRPRSTRAIAASPAPARSPVRQRASARSSSPSSSSSARPDSASSSARASDSEPSRRCTRASRRAGGRPSAVVRAASPAWVTAAAGGARSSPRRCRAGATTAIRRASSRNSSAARRVTSADRTASTDSRASSSVNTRSWSASWPPIHDARWRVSSMRSSRPPERYALAFASSSSGIGSSTMRTSSARIASMAAGSWSGSTPAEISSAPESAYSTMPELTS